MRDPDFISFFVPVPPTAHGVLTLQDAEAAAVLAGLIEPDQATVRLMLSLCAAGREPEIDVRAVAQGDDGLEWRLKAKHAAGAGGCAAAFAPVFPAEPSSRRPPAASREQEERELARAIIMSAPFEINLRDPARRYRFINPTFERFFGLPVEEALGRRSDEVFGTAAGVRYDADVELAEQNGITKHLERGPYAEGEYLSVFTVRYPCADSAGRYIGVASISVDVTELNKEAHRWREILDAMPDPVVACDVDGALLLHNRAAEQMLRPNAASGPGAGRAVQQAWESVVWRDLSGEPFSLRDHLERIASGAPAAATSWIARASLASEARDDPGASGRWFEIIVRQIDGSRSEGAGFMVLLKEADELLRLQEATRKASSGYRLLAENAADMVLLVSADGLVEYASPSFERTLGYAPADLIETSLLRIVDPKVHQEVKDRLKTLVAGVQPLPMEYPVIDGQGRRHIIECNARPVPETEQLENAAAVISWRDVTERRKAEGERYLLQCALDGVSQALCLFDGDRGEPLQCNQPFRKLLETPTESAERFWRERLNEPRDPQAEALLEALSRRTSFSGVVLVRASQDEAATPVHVILDWIDDPETGAPRYIAFDCMDYSAEYTRLTALEKAYEQERNANLGRSAMVRALSHDLRQPIFALGLIVGAVKPIVERDDPDIALALTHSVESLRRMLGDLAEVSRLSGRSVTATPRRFVVRDLLKRACEELLPAATESGMSLVVSPRVRRATLFSDPDLIFRILRNLMVNAVNHSGASLVTLTARRDRGGCSLEVTDDGVGLPEDLSAQAFREYVRGPGKRGDGLGLGLSIVQGIVDLLGGRIRLETPECGGARFIIYLPDLPETHNAEAH